MISSISLAITSFRSISSNLFNAFHFKAPFGVPSVPHNWKIILPLKKLGKCWIPHLHFFFKSSSFQTPRVGNSVAVAAQCASGNLYWEENSSLDAIQQFWEFSEHQNEWYVCETQLAGSSPRISENLHQGQAPSCGCCRCCWSETSIWEPPA